MAGQPASSQFSHSLQKSYTRLGAAVLRLGAQLFDALPEGGAAVNEVQGDWGGRGQAAEGDRLAGAQHAVERRFGTGGRRRGPGGSRLMQAGRVAGPYGGHDGARFGSARAARWLVRAVTPAPATDCPLSGAASGLWVVLQRGDDGLQRGGFAAAALQPDVVLAHRLARAGAERLLPLADQVQGPVVFLPQLGQEAGVRRAPALPKRI